MMMVSKSAEVPKVQSISFSFPVLPLSPYYLEKGHWPGQSHQSVLMRSGWQVSYARDSYMSLFFTRPVSWAVIPPASKISIQGNSWFPLQLKSHYGFNKIIKKIGPITCLHSIEHLLEPTWVGRAQARVHPFKQMFKNHISVPLALDGHSINEWLLGLVKLGS